MPTADGNFVGEVYGLDEANAALTPNDAVSQRGAAVLAGNFPGVFFDAAQTHFLCAEAAERGWSNTPLDAEGHYNAAVTLSMQWWGSDGRRWPSMTTSAQADVAYTHGAWRLEAEDRFPEVGRLAHAGPRGLGGGAAAWTPQRSTLVPRVRWMATAVFPAASTILWTSRHSMVPVMRRA